MQSHQINDWLFISGIAVTSRLDTLKKARITHIINATFEYPNTFPDDFEYLHIPAVDRASERLAPYFARVIAFGLKAQKKGGRVLVHCQEGISRSTTLAIAMLMQMEHLRLDEAFQMVKEVNPDTEPAPQFLRELRLLELRMFGNVTTTERLTLHDRGPLSPLTGQESVLESLAIVHSMSAVGVASSEEFAEARDALLDDMSQVPQDSIVPLLQGMIFETFSTYGQKAPRSSTARNALGTVLAVFAHRQHLSKERLQSSLETVFTGDHWVDFLMDVPMGRCFATDLLTTVESLLL